MIEAFSDFVSLNSCIASSFLPVLHNFTKMSTSSNPPFFKPSLKILGKRTNILWQSPIYEFIVERKKIADENGQWEKIGSVPSNRGNYVMENWPDISNYEYRVVARMTKGISVESGPAKTSPPLGVVEKNGEETPGTPVRTPTEVLLMDIFKSAEKSASATVPSPPNKPLTVGRGLHGSSLVVSWSPSTTDGGSPILAYIIQHANPHKIEKFGESAWREVTRVLGTETEVTFNLKNAGEAIRVIAENSRGQSLPLVSGGIRKRDPLPPTVDVDASNERYIEIKWFIPKHFSLLLHAETSSYFILKRWKKSKKAKVKSTVLAKELMATSFRDYKVMPGERYQYLVGTFGRTGKKKMTKTPWTRFGSELMPEKDEASPIDQAQKASSD